MRKALVASVLGLALASGGARAADQPAMPLKAPAALPSFDWTGLYVGGHFGYAGGTSNWAMDTVAGPGPGASGSINLFQRFNAFTEAGSYLAGLQVGYNRMLANRMVLGAEADVSFPSFPNLAGISIGGAPTFVTPTLGPESYSENVVHFGTLRGRIGYAPGAWLFYATGGFAWTYDQLSLTQLANGTMESAFHWRLGWAAGVGVEAPVAPHWTMKLEYLFTDFGKSGVTFPAAGQQFISDFALQQLRVGLNYRLGDDAASPGKAAAPDGDRLSLHGQATFVEQAYPGIRSPYQGQNSLPASGQGRETFDLTLFAGMRLWQGAELWFNPELDQGFGLANTHGAAGFSSAEAFKEGSVYPYARIQRAFLRQTIDLGGNTEKVDADTNQFAGTRTADRLVFTVGRFAIVDIFDTNKYANNAKSDFLNWSLVNAGTFDYAGDAWGFTYGAAAEWYQDRWTLRAGAFDLSATPAGGVSPLGGTLDPTFRQYQLVGEIEERHELWGEPGKLKVTGFLSHGRAGLFADAIALAQATGQPADITAVRNTTNRTGVSVNLEQQVSETLGVFARAGWADGNIEPWDFTDIDRTISGGVSINGKRWGRPDDTVGIAGVVNGISGAHQAFLNAGGLGILIGDGQLPHPGPEQILEAYYSYALSASAKLSFDYQFIVNPGYNTDRGPASVFSGRFHWTF
ncbi:MAG TPA: carbohydrate porin [Xanthobacteraceae bacterium]|nr:carbohydrate porin [Xanthobacteraceae bacterium]